MSSAALPERNAPNEPVTTQSLAPSLDTSGVSHLALTHDESPPLLAKPSEPPHLSVDVMISLPDLRAWVMMLYKPWETEMRTIHGDKKRMADTASAMTILFGGKSMVDTYAVAGYFYCAHGIDARDDPCHALALLLNQTTRPENAEDGQARISILIEKVTKCFHHILNDNLCSLIAEGHPFSSTTLKSAWLSSASTVLERIDVKAQLQRDADHPDKNEVSNRFTTSVYDMLHGELPHNLRKTCQQSVENGSTPWESKIPRGLVESIEADQSPDFVIWEISGCVLADALEGNLYSKLVDEEMKARSDKLMREEDECSKTASDTPGSGDHLELPSSRSSDGNSPHANFIPEASSFSTGNLPSIPEVEKEEGEVTKQTLATQCTIESQKSQISKHSTEECGNNTGPSPGEDPISALQAPARQIQTGTQSGCSICGRTNHLTTMCFFKKNLESISPISTSNNRRGTKGGKNSADKKTPKISKKGRPKSVCSYCKKPNHTIAECRTKSLKAAARDAAKKSQQKTSPVAKRVKPEEIPEHKQETAVHQTRNSDQSQSHGV